MPDVRYRPWALEDRDSGPYAERRDPEPSAMDRAIAGVYGHVAWRLPPGRRWLARMARRVESYGKQLENVSDAGLKERAEALRIPLRRHGFRPDLVVESFALIREVSGRRLGMKHYPVQVMGGLALIEGMLAEMQTGEGKTITAGLAAVTAALAGMPVHVVTVNDYLAARDAEILQPVFDAFGLSFGVVQHGQEPPERRAIYAKEIVYGANKEIAFDYLRDRIALGRRRHLASLMVGRLSGAAEKPLFLRGLHFAIVDEADSVLVDDARTPLIISAERGGEEAEKSFRAALDFAGALEAEDYTINRAERSVRLTPEGLAKSTDLAKSLGGLYAARRAREELVEQALSALHLFRRDVQYIVADDKVHIVDESTGRVAEGRTWQRGLHQMIEIKEGVAVTGERDTLSSITYQRFFRRYLRLAGMSGTVAEIAPEMWSVYRLKMVRIPTHRTPLRRRAAVRIFVSEDKRWEAVVDSAFEYSRQGRPVLIGTRSVQASEEVARRLTAAGLAHVVLNARQDKEEAQIVAGAGAPGQITVATNMAGRGTDIKLTREARAAGGLHVILTEFHESARVDRQLIGRGGRQGDPSTWEVVASLEDEMFQMFGRRLAAALRLQLGEAGVISGASALALRQHAQRAAERFHASIRRATLAADRKFDKMLAFSGAPE